MSNVECLYGHAYQQSAWVSPPDGFSLEISAAWVDFLPPITGEPEGGRR